MIRDILIVDGYNMIGAWPELRALAELDLEAARDRLIDMLAEYQGYTGRKVLLVFDAHQVPGLGARLRQSRIEVLYTREKETADECIERLVSQLSSGVAKVYVATSDHVEQRVVFGKGALRLSARELLYQLEENRRQISRRIRQNAGADGRNTFDARLDDDVRELLERWRRGET